MNQRENTTAQVPCPMCGLPLRMFYTGDKRPHCGNRRCAGFKGTYEQNLDRAEREAEDKARDESRD